MTLDDEKLHAILKAYAAGDISAAAAAYDMQALALPGFENAGASEIIIWAKDAGYGIPTPSAEAVRAEVAYILSRRAGAVRQQTNESDDTL